MARKVREPLQVYLDQDERQLLDRMAEEVARKEKVPPYVVGSDRTLREIAMMRPTNEGDLGSVHGIGPAKIEKYGEAILTAVRSAGAAGATRAARAAPC